MLNFQSAFSSWTFNMFVQIWIINTFLLCYIPVSYPVEGGTLWRPDCLHMLSTKRVFRLHENTCVEQQVLSWRRPNIACLLIIKLVLSPRREQHAHVWCYIQCVQNYVLACTRACVFQNMYPHAYENTFSNIVDLCELQIMFVFLI